MVAPAAASSATSPAVSQAASSSLAAPSNPLLLPWTGKYGGLPSWHLYQPEHFMPAIRLACAENLAEAAAIAGSTEPATFENTVLALDNAGELLSRVTRVLSHLCASATSPELQAIELESAPLLAAHSSAIYMGVPGLFARLDAVHSARAALPPQAARLTERLHLDFVRAGAQLDAASQARYAQVMEALASLHTTFSQNVLKDEEQCTLSVSASELEGCPPDILAAAAQVAADRGAAPGTLTLSLSRSQVEPVLTYAARGELRERLWRQWTRRGQLTPGRDNRAVLKQILALRAEQAGLHGYPSFADYQTVDTMARTPGKVLELLHTVWPKARASAEREQASLLAFAGSAAGVEGKEEGQGPHLAPWDWRYYAEQERAARYEFDEAALKPYLSLQRITAAIFDCAHKLFGLQFVPAQGLVGYHPDVQVYEVLQEGVGEGGQGEFIGYFCADNYARPNKQGGAWMSELRTARRGGGGRVYPVVVSGVGGGRGGGGGPATLHSAQRQLTLHNTHPARAHTPLAVQQQQLPAWRPLPA